MRGPVSVAAGPLGHGPTIYHVQILGPHPRVAGIKIDVNACGSADLGTVSTRSDLVRLHERCAENGCYERWPSTPADEVLHHALRSPYGRRAAKLAGVCR